MGRIQKRNFYVNPHLARLEVSDLSKWGTNVLLLLFDCARERAGDYYTMGCGILAVEGETVELNPYFSKNIGTQAICSGMLQMTTGSKYLGKSDNLQQSFLELALLEFWAQ